MYHRALHTAVLYVRGASPRRRNRLILAARTDFASSCLTWLYIKHEIDNSMSKLVFIIHETPDGRPSRAEKSQIHAHTLQHNRRKGKRVAPSSSVVPCLYENLSDRTRSPEAKVRAVITEEDIEHDDPSGSQVVHEGHVTGPSHYHSTISVPLSIKILGRYGEDIQSIGKWYFHSQLDEFRSSHFDHAITYWTNSLWDMARVNQSTFAAVGAFALHKEVVMAKRPSNSAYLEQKGRTIWHISNDLSQPHCASDPLTMVAVALLAYMDLREGNFAATKTHLEAIRNLKSVTRMPTLAWLQCVWVDLRYALFTGQAPVIPHYIPPSLQRDTSTRSPQDTRMASENVAHCPQAAFFTHEIAFSIFDRLHALCRLPTQIGASETPPFGQIYDLEYSLRTVQSHVAKNELREPSASAVELVLLTVQLHTWMFCRFWTPQRRESHLAVVSRACSILDTFRDLTTRWFDFGSAESLLWVLFTMTACLHVHSHSYRTRLISLLWPVINVLNIQCHDDFAGELRRWPWLEDWHPVHTQIVWSALLETVEELSLQWPSSQPATLTRSQERLFLGGVEFWDGS